MKDILKKLMLIEGTLVFMAMLNGGIIMSMYEPGPPMDRQIASWLNLVLLGLVASGFCGMIFPLNDDCRSQDEGLRAKPRVAFKDALFINGISAVFTIAVLSAAFEIFSAIIENSYYHNVKPDPSGDVDRSISYWAEWAGRTAINALAPIPFFGARKVVIKLFDCLAPRVDDRTAEQRQSILNAQANITYGANL